MELMDIYDDEGRRTGKQMDRAALDLSEHENIRVVHLCIFNSKGQLLMQKRNANHGSFKDCWDVSAGGAVKAGEDSADAARREAAEELGLDLEEKDILFAKCFRIPHLFDDFYFSFQDLNPEELHINLSEVTRVSWMTLEEIRQEDEAQCLVNYGMELIREVFSLSEKLK